MVVSINPQKAIYPALEQPVSSIELSPGVIAVLTSAAITVIDLVANTIESFSLAGITGVKDFALIDSDRFVISLQNGLVIYSRISGIVTRITTATATVSRVKVRNSYILHQTGNAVSIYDQSLIKKGAQLFGVTEVLDFELDTANYLYVCGFQAQKNAGVPVQIAFLYKMFFTGSSISPNSPVTGQNLGKLWGFNATTLSANMADTRMNRLYIRNGKLYCLGSVYGGNSIFRYNGKDLTTPTQVPGDLYSQTWQTRDETGLYIAVVDLSTFTVLRGIELRTRLDNNDGNNIFPRTIYSDGTDIYVGGTAAFKIAGRSTLTWLSRALPAYKGDASFTVFSDSLASRRAWVTPGDGDPILFTNSTAVVRTTNNSLATSDNSQGAGTLSKAYAILW